MQKKYTITNTTGIHARPAKKIVEAAIHYPCDIYLIKEGIQFNAKSLVAMISIGARFKDQIIVAAEGEQAELAVEEIGMILSSKH